ncbi:MAG: hypothetical protein LBI13_01780 [Streptococcaceae bacterium]|jgi:hypothetical protein|nr:hypothetical protein [Streptococcaceae bacterium]
MNLLQSVYYIIGSIVTLGVVIKLLADRIFSTPIEYNLENNYQRLFRHLLNITAIIFVIVFVAFAIYNNYFNYTPDITYYPSVSEIMISGKLPSDNKNIYFKVDGKKFEESKNSKIYSLIMNSENSYSSIWTKKAMLEKNKYEIFAVSKSGISVKIYQGVIPSIKEQISESKIRDLQVKWLLIIFLLILILYFYIPLRSNWVENYQRKLPVWIEDKESQGKSRYIIVKRLLNDKILLNYIENPQKYMLVDIEEIEKQRLSKESAKEVRERRQKKFYLDYSKMFEKNNKVLLVLFVVLVVLILILCVLLSLLFWELSPIWGAMVGFCVALYMYYKIGDYKKGKALATGHRPMNKRIDKWFKNAKDKKISQKGKWKLKLKYGLVKLEKKDKLIFSYQITGFEHGHELENHAKSKCEKNKVKKLNEYLLGNKENL